MGRIGDVQLLAERALQELGYTLIRFENRKEEVFYFNGYPQDGDFVELKVVVDDESYFDEWSVYERHEGNLHWEGVN